MSDVLIVDDNIDIAEPLRQILEMEGHQVRMAGDGLEGLDSVEEAFPDIILLDVEMPLLDGPGMARRLQILNTGREKIPIVLLSATRDLRSIAGRVGTPYYLEKPYSIDRFLMVFQAALNDRIYPKPKEKAA